MIDAGDLNQIIDHAPRLDATNPYRKADAAFEGFDTPGPILAGGRLHDGNRPNRLARDTGLVHEKIDMRLKKTAGTELNNPSSHSISTSALTKPALAVVQRGKSAVTSLRLVR